MQGQFQMWLGLVSVVVIDQSSKWYATHQGLVDINRGISFGWLAAGHESGGEWLMIGVTVCALLGLACWGRDLWQRSPLAASLIFGGGVSNLLDRVWSRGVRDWLTVPGTDVKNNVADWCIVLGILWIGVTLLRRNQRNETFYA